MLNGCPKIPTLSGDYSKMNSLESVRKIIHMHIVYSRKTTHDFIVIASYPYSQFRLQSNKLASDCQISYFLDSAVFSTYSIRRVQLQLDVNQT
jgi:hypothetical protein